MIIRKANHTIAGSFYTSKASIISYYIHMNNDNRKTKGDKFLYVTTCFFPINNYDILENILNN